MLPSSKGRSYATKQLRAAWLRSRLASMCINGVGVQHRSRLVQRAWTRCLSTSSEVDSCIVNTKLWHQCPLHFLIRVYFQEIAFEHVSTSMEVVHLQVASAYASVGNVLRHMSRIALHTTIWLLFTSHTHTRCRCGSKCLDHTYVCGALVRIAIYFHVGS